MKEAAIRALAAATSLETEETEHRLLRFCHDLLTGLADMTALDGNLLIAFAKQSTNEVHFNERLAAAMALDGRHEEAVNALRAATAALDPSAMGLRIVTPEMTVLSTGPESCDAEDYVLASRGQ